MGSVASFTNSVISHNESGSDAGVTVNGSTVTFTNSVVWGNTPADFSGMTDPTGSDGNLSADPLFLDLSPADPADWDLHLDTSSTLIDAGDSALSDPDGSSSDIGLYGGPDADLFDLDGDGYFEWWQPGAYDSSAWADGADCHDRDPELNPDDGGCL